jgi:hypothetical protein
MACCAETGAVQHVSATNSAAAKRDVKYMKESLISNPGRRLNLTPT